MIALHFRDSTQNILLSSQRSRHGKAVALRRSPLPFSPETRFHNSERYLANRTSIDSQFSVTCSLYHLENRMSMQIFTIYTYFLKNGKAGADCSAPAKKIKIKRYGNGTGSFWFPASGDYRTHPQAHLPRR